MAAITATSGRPRPWPPRASRTGGAGPAGSSAVRHVGRRPQADPAEGALVPVPPPDMPHRGPVVALVVAGLDLAPAAVPHRLPPLCLRFAAPPTSRARPRSSDRRASPPAANRPLSGRYGRRPGRKRPKLSKGPYDKYGTPCRSRRRILPDGEGVVGTTRPL